VSGKPVNILLVEDDKVDVMAFQRALHDLKVGNPLYLAGNGIDALDMLRGENGRDMLPRPCLVLLDLNMPRMGGIEFLQEIRADPALKRLVVIVMTTSSSEEDRMRAYKLNIAGYIVKNRIGQSFLESITMLTHYWRVVEFPADV
jgi:CheY-like chemotaxis protein